MSEEQKSASITLNATIGKPTSEDIKAVEDLQKQLSIPDKTPLDELPGLKARADTLGLAYSNNIGVDALRTKIREHITAQEESTKSEIKTKEEVLVDGVDQNTCPLNQVTDNAILRKRIYEESMFLQRVRISNLNPLKKDIPGEFFTVSNKYLGTVRKYIPFGEATDNGYHVPKVILDAMKERKFLSVKVKKDSQGNQLPSGQWVREFAIEELPYLTKEELDQLARQQAAAQGL